MSFVPEPAPTPGRRDAVAATTARGSETGARSASLALWHAGWAVTSALAALAISWFEPGMSSATVAAIAVMALPGAAGVMLMWRDGVAGRFALMAGWLLAAVAAAGLTGGVTGAVPGFVVMPLAAGVALEHGRIGDDRMSRVGALAVGLAVASGLISSWLNGTQAQPPLLAAFSSLLALVATVAAMQLTWRRRRQRMVAAEDAAADIAAFLDDQPALTLMLQPSGQLLDAHGTAPPSLSVDALAAQGLIAAVHAPDRPAVAAAIARALAGQDAEVLFTPRAALDRRVTLVLRRFGGGGEPRLIAQAFDATAQFARELGLENARAEAEAHSAGKTRFLANMSHELRTPLNAVLGFSDIMRQRLFGPLPERYAGYADSIHEAGGHLLELINDVLDLSKIEAERYQLTLEDFDARDAVSAALTLVRVQADDKGVDLAGVLSPDPLDVTADRRALKQIALNLLSNGVKFTPVGGSVTLTLDAIGPYLELVVSDTGVGIAPEDVKRLGRPFEQAGGAEQRAQGTGLGLSLVRSLAELHGGRMSIDSTLGEGTAITVRLPVVPTSRPAVAAVEDEARAVGNVATAL